LHQIGRISTLSFGALVAFERAAAACPFCGGSGGELLESLVVVAVLGFGGRALWRAVKRRRTNESEPSAPSERR
jgi:hypothetical protein